MFAFGYPPPPPLCERNKWIAPYGVTCIAVLVHTLACPTICRCARDTFEGRSAYECTPTTGNFSELQQFSNFEFCVDDNGDYKVGPVIPRLQ